jgi:methionine-rich copper-binding protein CopC
MTGPGRRWWLALIAAALAWPAAPAFAHAELRRSVPEPGAVLRGPPERIELHFSERVQVTALRLHRAGGREVPLPGRRGIREAQSDAVELPPLEHGEYRIEWRALSGDGHAIGGSIGFRVAAPPAAR